MIRKFQLGILLRRELISRKGELLEKDILVNTGQILFESHFIHTEPSETAVGGQVYSSSRSPTWPHISQMPVVKSNDGNPHCEHSSVHLSRLLISASTFL